MSIDDAIKEIRAAIRRRAIEDNSDLYAVIKTLQAVKAPTKDQPVELSREEFGDKMATLMYTSAPLSGNYEATVQQLKRYIDCAYTIYTARFPKRELSKEDLAGYKFDTSEYITIGLHPARMRESVSIENAAWAIIRLWEKLGTITWRDMAETCAKEWRLPTTDIEVETP